MKKITSAPRLKSPRVASAPPRIHEVRGIQVVLDVDLARVYEVKTYHLNEAVKRNPERFPESFCFQLTRLEWQGLISQIAISNAQLIDSKEKSISEPDGRGGRRSPPYAFTEHGVVMIAGLLKSPCATAVSIQVVQEFVRLRRAALTYGELSQRIDQLESRMGDEVQDVWNVLRRMLSVPEPVKNPIGFIAVKDQDALSRRRT